MWMILYHIEESKLQLVTIYYTNFYEILNSTEARNCQNSFFPSQIMKHKIQKQKNNTNTNWSENIGDRLVCHTNLEGGQINS